MSLMEGLKAKILAEIVRDPKYQELSFEKKEKIQIVIDEEFAKCKTPRALIDPRWLQNLYQRIREVKQKDG